MSILMSIKGSVASPSDLLVVPLTLQVGGGGAGGNVGERSEQESKVEDGVPRGSQDEIEGGTGKDTGYTARGGRWGGWGRAMGAT